MSFKKENGVRDDDDEDGFVAVTADIGSASVLVGCSANLEMRVEAELARSDFPNEAMGQKHIVRQLTVTPTLSGGYECEILMPGDRTVRLSAHTGHVAVPAGSSVNTAFVLKKLGFWDVGVIAPIGRGRQGRSLKLALESEGIRFGLFPSDGTAFTLSVYDAGSDKTTLFCEKRPYGCTPGFVTELARFRPKLFVATSVKPGDLSLVEALFRRLPQEVIRVFVPHPELLKHPNLRGRLCALIAQANLVQINEREACLLMDKDAFVPDDIFRVAELGARRTVVTFGALGAAAVSDGQMYRQEPFGVDAKDTSGAGDAHLTALLYHLWLQEEWSTDLSHALRFAGWVAASKVAHIGPWSGIPAQEERVRKLAHWSVPRRGR